VRACVLLSFRYRNHNLDCNDRTLTPNGFGLLPPNTAILLLRESESLLESRQYTAPLAGCRSTRYAVAHLEEGRAGIGPSPRPRATDRHHMYFTILKMIATSGFLTALECTEFVSAEAPPRTQLREHTPLPRPPSWFKGGPTSKGREG